MKGDVEFDDQQMASLATSGGKTFTADVNILDDWDSDDGICSSRSPKKTCGRIAKLVLFLVCFFGLLALFSAGVMILSSNMFNGNDPEEIADEEQTVDGEVPNLIFEPRIDKHDTLIHCSYDSSVTRPYLKRMNSFIKNLNKDSYNSRDCNDDVTQNGDRPCRFNMSQLGNVCTKKRKYGFDDCRVCVALTLEPKIEWRPLPYENSSVPMEIRERYRSNAVPVTCRGETPSDEENMGPITYYPPEGFHYKFFPYLEQESYNTPLVMVHFENPGKLMNLRIQCFAWAKNIDHNKNEGLTKFELYLE